MIASIDKYAHGFDKQKSRKDFLPCGFWFYPVFYTSLMKRLKPMSRRISRRYIPRI